MGIGNRPRSTLKMTYQDFQHLARLYVVGVLEEDEMEQFRLGRTLFGEQAEEFINECRKLNSAFALSLRPIHTFAVIGSHALDRRTYRSIESRWPRITGPSSSNVASGSRPSCFRKIPGPRPK